MALFRRGATSRTAQDPSDQTVDPQDATPDADPDAGDGAGEQGGADASGTTEDAPADRSAGPWDSHEDAPGGARVDLGALRVPAIAGMAVRMEIDKKSSTITGVAITLEGSTLQMQAFAAPRTDGIWEEIRTEIARSVSKQGGSVDDLPGPFGRELLARLPVRTPEGRTGHRPARFIGVDGPRWFLRGVITGRAAVDPEAAAAVEDVYRRTVVFRDSEARPPRELLALTMPTKDGAKPAEETAEDAPGFDPLTRGPEITEIR